MKRVRDHQMGDESVRRKRRKCKKKLRLPVVDLVKKQERCVLLIASDADEPVEDFKLVAWYPKSGEVGIPSTLVLPPQFRPIDSCAGFICGIHIDCMDEFSPWKFRVAVSNPSTNYQVELPLLDISHLPPGIKNCAESDFYWGELRLKMTPPPQGERFCVHLTTSCGGEQTIHSFNTTSWRWETSTTFSGKPLGDKLVGEILFRYRDLRSYDVVTRKWTAIAGPEKGKPWHADFPVPERFKDSTYRFMFPFRYGEKVMAACRLSNCEFVLLELREKRSWVVVADADEDDFPSCCSLPSTGSWFCVDWPVVGGDLLVVPCTGFTRPPVFDLSRKVWMEVPPALAKSKLLLHAACVYQP